MSYNIFFLPKARQELLKAWEWYEDRQSGLGDRFKEIVFDQLKIIGSNPERHPEKKKNYREIGISVFPYLIIYKIKKRSKEVIVVSIFHTSRNPHKKYKK